MKLKNSGNHNFKLPSDKSISHRLVLASLFCENTYQLEGLTISQDIIASLSAVKSLGVKVSKLGVGNYLFQPNVSKKLSSKTVIDCMNSGTTARLLLGIIAGKRYQQVIELTGDESLRHRPMKRVTEPLKQSGFELSPGEYLPIEVQTARKISCLNYELPIASAQVKSALLFAAIQIKGESILTGSLDSRDHTEKLFQHAGVDLVVQNDRINVVGPQQIKLLSKYSLPSDPSAAAFWCLYAGLTKIEVNFNNLLLNPSRLGFYQVLQLMGASITYKDNELFYEPMGDMRVCFSGKRLEAIHIKSSMVASLIDEIPILSVFAALVDGETIISGVSELRYKESDRLQACVSLAQAFGAQVSLDGDSLSIIGCSEERTYDFNKLVESRDHRIVMILAIISKACDISIEIKYPESVSVSYPDFWEVLEQV